MAGRIKATLQTSVLFSSVGGAVCATVMNDRRLRHMRPGFLGLSLIVPPLYSPTGLRSRFSLTLHTWPRLRLQDASFFFLCWHALPHTNKERVMFVTLLLICWVVFADTLEFIWLIWNLNGMSPTSCPIPHSSNWTLPWPTLCQYVLLFGGRVSCLFCLCATSCL